MRPITTLVEYIKHSVGIVFLQLSYQNICSDVYIPMKDIEEYFMEKVDGEDRGKNL